MEAIGGYFGLELNGGEEFHKNALRLNTGRNALEYVLRANAYKKIFIPYYTCDVLLEPINKLNIEYEFYSIGQDFEPVFEFGNLGENEVFLYTNYFGLKDEYIQKISKNCTNLIIDNAQAFFSLPTKGADTFYSARKFFGVPDGAYLYPTKKLDTELEEDVSYNRFDHLLMRMDQNAEFGYSTFTNNETSLENNSIKRMSRLTYKLLLSINYEAIAEKRRANFNYLNSKLRAVNLMNDFEIGNQVPMIYPFLNDSKIIRKRLISNRVFPAQYWPNVLSWAKAGSFEYQLASSLISIPLDQRYGQKEMDRIISIITNQL